MLDIDAVYQGLAAAINGAAIQGTTRQVTATAFSPDLPEPPHFFCAEFDGTYDRTFGGQMELVVTARLMLSRADDDGESGQREAFRLASAGADTIREAINEARGAPGEDALDGACDDLYLRRVTGPRLYDYGDDNFYGLEFTIFVMG